MDFERLGDFHLGVGEEIVYNNQKLVGALFFFCEKCFRVWSQKCFPSGGRCIFSNLFFFFCVSK